MKHIEFAFERRCAQATNLHHQRKCTSPFLFRPLENRAGARQQHGGARSLNVCGRKPSFEFGVRLLWCMIAKVARMRRMNRHPSGCIADGKQRICTACARTPQVCYWCLKLASWAPLSEGLWSHWAVVRGPTPRGCVARASEAAR